MFIYADSLLNSTMSLLAILTSIFGMGMALANFPQAYRIFSRKSAGDISFLTYFLITIGSITWLIYGIIMQNIPIILTYSLGTVGCAGVVTGLIMHK
jgi:uncharacterized protein with PQ loop repeat